MVSCILAYSRGVWPSQVALRSQRSVWSLAFLSVSCRLAMWGEGAPFNSHRACHAPETVRSMVTEVLRLPQAVAALKRLSTASRAPYSSLSCELTSVTSIPW